MDGIRIGTCVRHLPPEPHQAFIGSGVIFDLRDDGQRCSLVLLQGIVIADMARRHLLDGSWLISDRVMAPCQIAHLLANARRVFQWREAALVPALAALIGQIKQRKHSEPSTGTWHSAQRAPASAGWRATAETTLHALPNVSATIDTLPWAPHRPGDEVLAHAPDAVSPQEITLDLVRFGH